MRKAVRTAGLVVIASGWLICEAPRMVFAPATASSVQEQQDYSQPSQDAQAQNQPETYSISGRVVNAVTGEGIPRALVQGGYAGGGPNGNNQVFLFSRPGGFAPKAILTDSQGSFHFDNLPSGQYTFSARKPGYFDEREEGGGRRSVQQTLVTVGPGGDSSALVKLIPESVVAGRVVDEHGQPIEGLPLRLQMPQVVDGRRRWQPVSGAMTKEDGSFRIANLRAGTYYMHYGPRWRDDMFTDPQKAMGYAQGYYPNSINIAGASPVQARAGQTTELELNVRQTRGINIEGDIVGAAETGGTNCRVVDEDAMDAMIGERAGSDAEHFSLKVGAPGIYRLKCSHYGEPGTESWGQLRLNIDRDVKGLRMVMSPLTTVLVNVVQDSVRPAQTTNGGGVAGNVQQFSTALRLRAMDAEHQDYWTQQDAKSKGRMVVRGVEPGTYMLEASVYDQWYVASATYRGREAWREPIEIGIGGAGELDVVMRDDGGTITGALDGAGPLASRGVIVVDEARPQLPRLVNTDQNGQFRVTGLAPGRYRLFGFEAGLVNQVEYANPSALDRYTSKSQTVSVGAGEEKTVKLSAIEAVQ